MCIRDSYCEDRMVYVQELYIILDHILAYTPQQWTGWQGRYINELKENLRELWRATLTTRFFIQKEVMLEWYACFSHWAKENELLCRVVLVGWNTPTPYLAFRSQGRRLPGSKYKNNTNKKDEDDEAFQKLLKSLDDNISTSSC